MLIDRRRDVIPRAISPFSSTERTPSTSLRNLPFKISADEMYDIFGKYGAIRQVGHRNIRRGEGGGRGGAGGVGGGGEEGGKGEGVIISCMVIVHTR